MPIEFRITTSVFICAIYKSMSYLVSNRRQSLGTLRASQCDTWTMFYLMHAEPKTITSKREFTSACHFHLDPAFVSSRMRRQTVSLVL